MSLRSFVPAGALLLVFGLAADRSAGAAENYVADPAHSSTVFRAKHMNTSYVWGRFNEIAGSFTLDENNPQESRFEFQVKADSIDTGQAKRDQHLKSPDFFNVVQFPTINFKSQSVTKSGNVYEVTGDLTLHGVTKPVTVRVVPTGKGTGPTGAPIAGIDASFTLKRSDFGINKMLEGIGDSIWVDVCVEGKQK
jgi:polyisoprenoid-binding protein YceI